MMVVVAVIRVLITPVIPQLVPEAAQVVGLPIRLSMIVDA